MDQTSTHITHSSSHIHTKTEGDDVHDVSENLEASVDPDKAWEAEEPNGDAAEGEEDGKGETGKYTVSDEHSLIHAPAGLR